MSGEGKTTIVGTCDCRPGAKATEADERVDPELWQVLILVAIVLLLVLPSPWGLVAFVVLVPLWVLELLAWSRTVKHRRRVVGAETLIGREAIVLISCHPRGQVRLDGEIWEARCDAGAPAGESVGVVGRDGLVLLVQPARTPG